MVKVPLSSHSYMKVVSSPREMSGKGAPRDTTFGVIGHTKMEPMAKSLGGLVHHTADGPIKKGVLHRGREMTERNIEGRVSKTHIPKEHYGQVPFCGVFMSHLGARL
jgi:hypothetical protein